MVMDPVEIQDVKDLLELSLHLKNVVIPKIVRQLDDLKQVVLSNQQLVELFHSNGVNMRYLGLALGISAQSQVKVLLVVAMIARTAKQIFLQQISEKVLSTEQH